MIPARYSHVDYSHVPEAIRAKFDQVWETRRGMYLFGDVGTGKTHIAYALRKRWEEISNVEPIFWNVPELLESIKADFNLDPVNKARQDERLDRYTGMLFLDDIGAEKITDWVADRFYMIINHRYVNNFPTIITSNLTIKDLADKIGDRTVSRIVEMCDVVELIGEDKRISNSEKIKIQL